MEKKTQYYRLKEVTVTSLKSYFQRGFQRFLLPAALSVCMLSATNRTHAQVIATIAGNGIEGYAGDGGSAAAAQTDMPYSVASDDNGNVYFSDPANQVIRKVNSEGIITTVAGTGKAGYTGDGGQATDAQLNTPMGLAVDAAGNLYVADENNNVIRKIDVEGIITTIAGNGRQGYKGDGHKATRARLNQPYGVSVDAGGMVYIADTWNNVIRRVDPNSGIITTVAGNGTGGYTGDGGLATDASLNLPYAATADVYGSLYIADSWNNVIRKVNSLGKITTFAGTGKEGFGGDGGQALAASFDVPMGINIDHSGNVYVADASNQVIRKINSMGIVSSYAGNHMLGNGHEGDGYQSMAAQLNFPTGTSVDALGNVYVADHDNNCIRRIAPYRPCSDSNFMANSELAVNDTRNRDNGACVFNAKVNLASDHPAVGYKWSSMGSSDVQRWASAGDNNYELKVNPGTSATISAVVYLTDASFWSQSGACCQVVLNKIVVCPSTSIDFAQTAKLTPGRVTGKSNR